MVSAKLTSGTKKILHGVAHRQEPFSSHNLVAGELFLEARDLATELLNRGSNSSTMTRMESSASLGPGAMCSSSSRSGSGGSGGPSSGTIRSSQSWNI